MAYPAEPKGTAIHWDETARVFEAWAVREGSRSYLGAYDEHAEAVAVCEAHVRHRSEGESDGTQVTLTMRRSAVWRAINALADDAWKLRSEGGHGLAAGNHDVVAQLADALGLDELADRHRRHAAEAAEQHAIATAEAEDEPQASDFEVKDGLAISIRKRTR